MDHHGMSTEPGEITVRLDEGAAPITGEVQVAGGPRTRFIGWIGLLAFLERAIERLAGARAATDTSAAQRGPKG
jgi:hypothetical protein